MAKNIALGALCVLVLAGGAIYYRSRRVPVPVESGVPIYPGAQTDVDSFALRLSPHDRERLVKAVTYRTTDSPAKVIAFYKEQLKGKMQVIETTRRGTPSAVFSTKVDGKPKMIMVTYNEDTNQSEIAIGIFTPPPLR